MRIMIKIIKLASIVIIGLCPFTLYAADDGRAVIDTGSINQQFQYIITKSSRYNNYRAVRNEWLYKLKSHVNDTITELKNELNNSNQLLTLQSASIDSLSNALSVTKTTLDKTTLEKNSISFLGITLNKSIYNTIVWLLIATLAFILVILFITYKRSHAITVRTKHDLHETKEEFEAHRKKAREREEKMARRHLDEILKYKYEGKKPEPSNNSK